MQGKVKWFGGKGYGFIISEDESGHVTEYFVHHAQIQMTGFRTLDAGDEVEYDIDLTDTRGPKAINVKKVAGLVTNALVTPQEIAPPVE